MSEETSLAFDAALARLLDGEPEPGDADLIVRTLQSSPERMKAVSGLLAVDDLLRQHAAPSPEAFTEAFVARIEAEDTSVQFVDRVGHAIGERGAPPSARWTGLPWLAAAAALVVAAIGWWPGRFVSGPSKEKILVPVSGQRSEVLALLVNEAGARFAERAAPDAVSFGRGAYSLVSGAAHLRFRNGADVVLVAPARFAIDDALLLRMEEGRLRAFVPPSAHGFVVAAPGVRYKDLGTEFGVSVSAGDGQSKLHVFSGEVEIFREGEAVAEATITGGQSVSVNQGVVRAAGAPGSDQFPTPGEISLRRWNAQRDALRRDPELVCYFPFERDEVAPGTLRDEAVHGEKIGGSIEGAEWVTGRWPGKSALQFEHRDDAVAMRFSGDYEALTLAAWLKVDRFEHTMNIIVSSVGWREGGVQWQMDRRGNLAPTAVFSIPKRQPLWTGSMVRVGQWTHCAVTIERRTGQVLHYINGKLAGTAQVAPGSPLRPGVSQIGRWVSDNKAPDVRDFRGRIDELAVWRVVLPPARIAELAEAGMPIELPEFGDGRGVNGAAR